MELEAHQGESIANGNETTSELPRASRSALLGAFRRVVTVGRWVLGTVGSLILATVLVTEGRPSQRPWLALVVGLIVLGSAVAILKTRANR